MSGILCVKIVNSILALENSTTWATLLFKILPQDLENLLGISNYPDKPLLSTFHQLEYLLKNSQTHSKNALLLYFPKTPQPSKL